MQHRNSHCEHGVHVFMHCAQCAVEKTRVQKALLPAAKPIDMILFCPACGVQHIDAPQSKHDLYETSDQDRPEIICDRNGEVVLGLCKRCNKAECELGELCWENPPHRSHLCHRCGHIWRPADVPTNGAAEIKTRGKNDSTPIRGSAR